MRELRNILFQKGLRWLCTGPLKFYMQQQILNIIFVFASISYTHAQLLFPCSFSAVNHHNNKNWVPSILAHNLWLIFTGMKQKKKSKWPTQKNWVLQLLQFSILFSQKDIENWRFWKTHFFKSAILNSFFFASSPWKSVTNYELERMGLNFYYYDGLQPKNERGNDKRAWV